MSEINGNSGVVINITVDRNSPDLHKLDKLKTLLRQLTGKTPVINVKQTPSYK